MTSVVRLNAGGLITGMASHRTAENFLRIGRRTRRRVTIRCCSASGRRPRPRSSLLRSLAVMAADYRRRLEPENKLHNDGLPRIGLKMATGTGNGRDGHAHRLADHNKVMTPKDARFAKRFLVVTPGITIRDRLGVLHPEREDNYYRERDLVPPDLWDALLQAQVEIVNYHAFLPRDAKEIQGIASTTRKLLRGGNSEALDAFEETLGHGLVSRAAAFRYRQGRSDGLQR